MRPYERISIHGCYKHNGLFFEPYWKKEYGRIIVKKTKKED